MKAINSKWDEYLPHQNEPAFSNQKLNVDIGLLISRRSNLRKVLDRHAEPSILLPSGNSYLVKSDRRAVWRNLLHVPFRRTKVSAV